MNMNLSNEGQECKAAVLSERMLVGWVGKIWLMYFIYLYEERTLEPVDFTLSREEGLRERNGEYKPKQCTL
jgi:hypothetical protein